MRIDCGRRVSGCTADRLSRIVRSVESSKEYNLTVSVALLCAGMLGGCGTDDSLTPATGGGGTASGVGGSIGEGGARPTDGGGGSGAGGTSTGGTGGAGGASTGGAGGASTGGAGGSSSGGAGDSGFSLAPSLVTGEVSRSPQYVLVGTLSERSGGKLSSPNYSLQSGALR